MACCTPWEKFSTCLNLLLTKKNWYRTRFAILPSTQTIPSEKPGIEDAYEMIVNRGAAVGEGGDFVKSRVGYLLSSVSQFDHVPLEFS